MKSPVFLSAVAMLLLAGCGKEMGDGPPEIKFGRDECSHCGMIISDKRYAAALIANDQGAKKTYLFDDIGDMLDFQKEHASLSIRKSYVVDRETAQWLPADQAHFARIETLQTPMGSGIAAFNTDDAGKVISLQIPGKLLTLDQLNQSRH